MLHLHRSERADNLVDALGDLLCGPMSDPMVPEVVSVPTRGVERWITQQLSHRLGAGLARDDGVCANVEFPFPGRLVSQATASACGCQEEQDWWAPEHIVWPLLELIDSHLDSPELAPLAAHLRAAAPLGQGGRPRRFATARHLAELFDRYAVHRPAMLNGWLEGGADALGDLAPEDRWQGHLWLMLRSRAGVPGPAERFEAAPALLRTSPELVDLPERFSLFGLTRLPASHLEVLLALAANRDVHLYLLHPSPVLWRGVLESLNSAPLPHLARQNDRTKTLPAHPLLRSWGRDAREMQLVLASRGACSPGEATDDHRPVDEAPQSLLGLVQAAVRADMAPPGAPLEGQPDQRPVLAVDDNSLVVHSCHGRSRQVEVAREAILHLMAEDPTLEPRHVIVMCPDIELFAPLVQAAFDPSGGPPGALAQSPALASTGSPSLGTMPGFPELRARLADRSLRQTNPMLATAARLLELADARLTASEVLDLAAYAPVARRFGFSEDDLSTLQQWLAGTGVRWGADAEHRRPWKLDNLAEGTWQQGLDRLALGMAMPSSAEYVLAGLLPYGDVAGADADLAGRLCEMESRLVTALDRLSVDQSAAKWVAALAAGVISVAEGDPAQPWENEQLFRALAELPAARDKAVSLGAIAVGAIDARSNDAGSNDAGSNDAGSNDALLSLAEARAMFSDALRGRPTRANFRTGDLTVCSLVPMRSVPHRVVCLMGLDDGLFPRRSAIDGDDLLALRPEVGDRDVPNEDRQLLLDALLSATEHLIVTFEGRDQHINQRHPPAVTIGELLDVVDQTARLAGTDKPARHNVLVEHPLQPFDPRNYTPGAVAGTGPWRFDRLNLAGARALNGPRRPSPPFMVGKLPPSTGPVVPLLSLTRFLEHPVRAFLRERLGYFGPEPLEPIFGTVPVELGPLERWSLGDRLLEAYLNDWDLSPAIAAELGRGLLPPGALAEPMLRDVVSVIQALAAEVVSLPEAAGPGEPVEVRVALPEGTVLAGRVPGVRNGLVLRCTYSKMRAKHRLRAWAHFLAVSAAHPGAEPIAVTIAQAEGSKPARPRVVISRLGPLPGDPDQRAAQATRLLADLVSLYRLGMSEPLPLYCATSAAWAAARPQGRAEEAAREQWSSDLEERPGEGSEPEHLMVLGGKVDFSAVLAEAPEPGDPGGDGGGAGERTRFGRLAAALWGPVLAHESMTWH